MAVVQVSDAHRAKGTGRRASFVRGAWLADGGWPALAGLLGLLGWELTPRGLQMASSHGDLWVVCSPTVSRVPGFCFHMVESILV